MQLTSRFSPLKIFGDIMQVANHLFCCKTYFLRKKGSVPFTWILFIVKRFFIIHKTKLIAKNGAWQLRKRHYIEDKKDRLMVCHQVTLHQLGLLMHISEHFF